MTGSGETIAAVATAPGRGGVAVIRVSGPDAFLVGERLTRRAPRPGRVAFTTFVSPDSQAVLDAGICLSFKAPHSYTGEDVVEFQCHGGSVTPRRVLEACFAAGARPARRGEFTERAFLNGRLDYDQAESVLDLIDAKTDRAAEAALQGLAGQKARRLRDLYKATLALSSTVEHALDIDEGDLPDGFADGLTDALNALRGSFARTLAKAREGRMLREGALVVLAGAPNAGKSSLLNALLGENRAIVSPIAGTTRDSIEAWLDLDGWPVRLVDTAGLRFASPEQKVDDVEAEGVRRAEALMRQADIVVRLVAADADAPSDASPATENEIAVLSKSDLLSGEPPLAASGMLRLSTLTGDGLQSLKQTIVSRLEAKAETGTDFGTDSDRLTASLLAAQSQLPPDMDDLVLAGNALARTAEELGKPLGAVYSDDLLDALFSRFCVGK